ncbi:MAG: transglycosylase SLT domain-containing protein [Nanoarchaeota archaeon]|nr:transglycosylase SLT domain-containing protein [Nanoarchaeota archaeon]
MTKKLFLVFVVLTVFLGFASSYAVSEKFIDSRTGSFLGSEVQELEINSGMCETGQDFIIQIAPGGCSPPVVRSDILEEQDTPVFCKLQAFKINPAVKIVAIDSISFGGDYPDEVSTIAFLPTYPALGLDRQLTGAGWSDIGYAVIYLEKNPLESTIPDFVSGSLKARIRYSAIDAFGSVDRTLYLPLMSDAEFDERQGQYAFFNNMGYLRADEVGDNYATVSIYSGVYDRSLGNLGTVEKEKILTRNMEIGETSSSFFLPGFGCFASSYLRLDGIEGADTRAVLKVNSEVFEVKRGETFLDDKCSITDDPEKEGLRQTVKLSCLSDEKGRESFVLRIEPTINLSINNVTKEYKAGDWLYLNDDGDKNVYLGYVGTQKNKNNLENSLIGLVTVPGAVPENKKLDDATLKSTARGTEIKILHPEAASDYLKIAFGAFLGFTDWLFDGNNYEIIEYKSPRKVFGTQVEIISFGVGTNMKFGNETLSGYYGSAVKDYQKIKDNFASEVYPDGSEYFLGEKALKEAIDLSLELGQMEDLKKYCDLFKSNYPNSNLETLPCDGIPAYFNDGISSKTFLINGDYKQISFEGIQIPLHEEYGIEILVRKDGVTIDEPIKMLKGDTIYLEPLFNLQSEGEQIYSISNAIGSGGEIYFKYNVKWLWSADRINWMDGTTVTVSEGNFINQKPTTQVQQLISKLEGSSVETGKEMILKASGKVEDQEFIRLNEINDQESANINLHLKNRSAFSSIGAFLGSPNRNLELNSPYNIEGSEYVFTITKINFKRVAKVSIHTQIKESSEVNFSFNIGIEKRLIQLSPDQIKSQIEETKALTNKLESISNTLGTVVDTMKDVCMGTGAVLTLKNLIFNSGTQSLARTQVMNGEKGWYQFCKDKVREGVYSSNEACLFENSNAIETQVEEMSEIMSQQSENFESLENLKGVTNEGGFLGNDVVNQEKLIENYAPQVLGGLPSEVVNPDNSLEKINLTKVKDSLTLDRFKDGVYTLEDARNIELYSKLVSKSPSDTTYQKRLYTALYSLQVNSDNRVKLNEAASTDNLNPNEVTVLTVGKETKSSPYSGKLARDFTTKPFAGEFISTTPIEKIVTTEGKVYYAVLEEKVLGTLNIVRDSAGLVIYSESGVSRASQETLPVEFSQLYFKRYDANSYETPIKDPEIKYYETEPYKGLPAVVPFDVDNGWYVYIPQTISVTQTRAYDQSARVNNFWLCNAGSNGVVEYSPFGQDEICQLVNLGTGQPYNQFPGLEDSEATNLVRKAVSAVETASRAYKNGVSQVDVNRDGKRINVGSPAVDLPTTQCTDVMSPTDCQILFNACDPVICPSSRCDFGGDFPVRDVIQSGVIGSVALCLPNWNEGIYVPVCLTGVKAGLDGFISVTKSYQSCLETSLNEGKTVGICDEIYSIYGCELIWRTALPIVQLTIPKLDTLIFGGGSKGGGEYIGGIQGALENAESSVDFFTQNYAISSYDAFKARSQEEVGTAVCKNFISVAFPQYAGALNVLSQSDSPPQFTANFEAIPFSSVTNPPQAHYKVFFHIFAGNNAGAYYQVYLKTDGSSFYRDISPIRTVDSGYIAVGGYETETIDFTAPEGYKELCVRVNNQEECGFGSVTTDFALDYLKEKYLQSEANTTDIKTQEECTSGGPNLYNLLGLNAQEGFSDLIDPAVYNDGIVRVCATENPGSQSDGSFGTPNQRWVEVGYCGEQNVKCWIDKESIAKTMNTEWITYENTLESLTETLVENLKNQKGMLNNDEFDAILYNITNEESPIKRISLIESIYNRVFENNKKGYLLLLEGNAYAELARGLFKTLGLGQPKIPDDFSCKSPNTCFDPSVNSCEGQVYDSPDCSSGSKCCLGGGVSPTDPAITDENQFSSYTSNVYNYIEAPSSGAQYNYCYRFIQGTWERAQKNGNTCGEFSVASGSVVSSKGFIEGIGALVDRVMTYPEGTSLSSGRFTLIGEGDEESFYFRANEDLTQNLAFFEEGGLEIKLMFSPQGTWNINYGDGRGFIAVNKNNLFDPWVVNEFNYGNLFFNLTDKNLHQGAIVLFEGKGFNFNSKTIPDTEESGELTEVELEQLNSVTSFNLIPYFQAVKGYYEYSFVYYQEKGWYVKDKFIVPTGDAPTRFSNWEKVNDLSPEEISTFYSDISNLISYLKTSNYMQGMQEIVKESLGNSNEDQKNSQLNYGNTWLRITGVTEISNLENVDDLYFKYENNQWKYGYDEDTWYVVKDIREKQNHFLGWSFLWETSLSSMTVSQRNLVSSLDGKPKIDGVNAIFLYGQTPPKETTPGTTATGCSAYYNDIKRIATEKGVDPYLVLAVMYKESSCNPLADSGSSYGLMQINTGVWCGKHGLPSNIAQCKEILLNNPVKNIEVGVQILVKYYQDSSQIKKYECDAFKSDKQDEPSISKTYSGWEGALRRYNGWGCARINNGEEVFADHDYVEKVVKEWNDFKSQKILDGTQNPPEFCPIITPSESVSSLSIASEKVLQAAKELNGKVASRQEFSNCWDAASYVYESAGVTWKCAYSDRSGKTYNVGDGITTTSSGSGTFVVNPTQCPVVDKSETDKLAGIRPGYLLSIYYGKSSGTGKDAPHNVIFIKWADPVNGVATLFDWNGPGKTFRYFDQSLKDSEHPTYMYWEPISK